MSVVSFPSPSEAGLLEDLRQVRKLYRDAYDRMTKSVNPADMQKVIDLGLRETELREKLSAIQKRELSSLLS